MVIAMTSITGNVVFCSIPCTTVCIALVWANKALDNWSFQFITVSFRNDTRNSSWHFTGWSRLVVIIAVLAQPSLISPYGMESKGFYGASSNLTLLEIIPIIRFNKFITVAILISRRDGQRWWPGTTLNVHRSPLLFLNKNVRLSPFLENYHNQLSTDNHLYLGGEWEPIFRK